jgi:hypothetical protein
MTGGQTIVTLNQIEDKLRHGLKLTKGPNPNDFRTDDEYWEAWNEWFNEQKTGTFNYPGDLQWPENDEPADHSGTDPIVTPGGLENDGRRLSRIVGTPVTQIWVVMANQLKTTVKDLKEDYTDEGIQDLYESYLRGLPESQWSKLIG